MIVIYLKEKKKRIALDLLFFLIFLTCFYLSDVQVDAIWYPSVLCFFFLLCYAAYDYWKFRNKHIMLEKMQKHVSETLENLPLETGLLEQDYQSLLKILFMHQQRENNKRKNENRENREYMTLWAHQIKTPITAMELILQEFPLEETTVEYTKELSDKLFEIEQYVDSSLQYMRLDTMTSDLVLAENDVFSMVKQAVRYFSRTFIRKGIGLAMEETSVKVITDEKWVVFVLKQILSNALKYTKKGKISIYMAPQREKVLVIEDTGIGIAEEELPRIMERGFTGYNGRMEKKATGIGLYLSYTIMEKLGHTIRIHSVVGEGTCVEIDFSHCYNNRKREPYKSVRLEKEM